MRAFFEAIEHIGWVQAFGESGFWYGVVLELVGSCAVERIALVSASGS